MFQAWLRSLTLITTLSLSYCSLKAGASHIHATRFKFLKHLEKQFRLERYYLFPFVQRRCLIQHSPHFVNEPTRCTRRLNQGESRSRLWYSETLQRIRRAHKSPHRSVYRAKESLSRFQRTSEYTRGTALLG